MTGLVLALCLAACASPGPVPTESTVTTAGASPAPAEPEHRFRKAGSDWVNVCALACLKTADDEPVDILLDADRYHPLHCFAFVEMGQQPDSACTESARALCNETAHRINTQEPAYYRCSVEYANCYAPAEMSACSYQR